MLDTDSGDSDGIVVRVFVVSVTISPEILARVQTSTKGIEANTQIDDSKKNSARKQQSSYLNNIRHGNKSEVQHIRVSH